MCLQMWHSPGRAAVVTGPSKAPDPQPFPPATWAQHLGWPCCQGPAALCPACLATAYPRVRGSCHWALRGWCRRWWAPGVVPDFGCGKRWMEPGAEDVNTDPRTPGMKAALQARCTGGLGSPPSSYLHLLPCRPASSPPALPQQPGSGNEGPQHETTRSSELLIPASARGSGGKPWSGPSCSPFQPLLCSCRTRDWARQT